MTDSVGLTAAELWFVTRLGKAGWKIVPVDATPEMVAAGEAAAPGRARAVWDAMTGQAPPLGRHVE